MKRIMLMLLLLVAMLIGCSDQSDPSNDSDQLMDSTHNSDQSADPSNGNNDSTNSSTENDQEVYTYFGIQGLEQSVENNRFKCKAAMNNREEVIWIYEAEETEDIDAEYLINVSKGKAELVLIKPDGSIETIVKQTGESKAEDYTSDVLHVEQGKNRIKFVTSGITEFEFDITISQGEFRNIGYYY